MMHSNQAGLKIVFSNLEPPRDVRYSRTWFLSAHNHQDFRILVSRNGGSQPRIVRKEAA